MPIEKWRCSLVLALFICNFPNLGSPAACAKEIAPPAMRKDIPTRPNLIVSRDKALKSQNYIFDLSGFDRMVRCRWYPPKCWTPVFLCYFSTSKDGRAVELQPQSPDLNTIYHESCRSALTNDKLFYIPADKARLSFLFDLNWTDNRSGLRIEPDSGQESDSGSSKIPLTYTRYGERRAPCILENNKGILALIDGDSAAAMENFKKALELNADYALAKHNLDLAGKNLRTNVGQEPAETAK